MSQAKSTLTAIEEVGFRDEVREWLAANFPPSLTGDGEAQRRILKDSELITGDLLLWRERMGGKGWAVPTWPAEYGGGGLSAAQARVLNEEMTAAGAFNPIDGPGVMMFGPTLLEYGTEDQKQEHLRGIASGKVRWCQGFSEPGAGSDLASLSTRADEHGDHFLVNGSKIWTSRGAQADMMFCLVRTDFSRKHDGISFVVFEMHQPGVKIRPIRLISGISPFCEVFFTDVKVPKANLIGPLNGGWTVAKRLLQHERSNMVMGGGTKGDAGIPLAKLAKKYVGEDQAGRIADSHLRMRIVDNEVDERAVQLTVRRIAEEAKGGSGPSTASSILKNVGMKVLQDKAELALEIMGYQGLGWEGEHFSDDELSTVREWLAGKAFSIFGGSHEVQNNIIAKRILGLPDPSQGR
jgi:Acyl-CoA dehydrogenases